MANNEYLSVSAFLTEQEKVPLVFNSGCSGLGREVDEQCETDDLPPGSAASMPLWLVPKLYEQNMVGPRMPDCFGDAVWMVVDAEPRIVPLREINAHFFEFGAKLNAMLRDAALGDQLEKAFVRRYATLLTEAHSTGDVKWRHLLTKEEEVLFDAGRESMRAFNAWKYSSKERIEVSAQVKAQKRRRAAARNGGGEGGGGDDGGGGGKRR